VPNMSEDNQADTCFAEVDNIKLKECADCDLVRYCSDVCLKEHEEACIKRVAEFRDELLFKQLDSSHLGDCPICMIPMPLDLEKSIMMNCCSKVICGGCYYANELREEEASLRPSCSFCRKPIPDTNDKGYKMMMKRIEANDPEAMCQWGREQYDKGDYSSAFEYYANAAELGHVVAHCHLAYLYHNGRGVEKDEKKEIHHFEEAAIGGHPLARHNLGCREVVNGNIERAVKHWIIAANQGSDESIQLLMENFKKGFVKKEDLAAALRAHQAAVDATKSPQREAAEEYYRILRDTIDAENSN